jgi:DNA-binding transcriptional LysR family regulator
MPVPKTAYFTLSLLQNVVDEGIVGTELKLIQSIKIIVTICFVDIKNFDLNLLRVFDALMRERHVSRAAALLNLSQPAASAALARLREALADPLLVRGKQGMQPTERALALAPQVQGLLAQLSATLAPPRLFEPASSTVTFYVAATDYYIDLALARLAQQLAGHAPGIRLALRPMVMESLVPQMERGELDVAIVNAARAPQSLRSRHLIKESFVGIARRGHQLLGKSGRVATTLAQFCATPQVLVAPRATTPGSDSFSGMTDEVLARQGRARRVALSVSQFRFAVDAVAASDWIAVFPARLAALHAHHVVAFKLPLAVPAFDLALAWHERTHRSAPHQWLREVLRQSIE